MSKYRIFLHPRYWCFRHSQYRCTNGTGYKADGEVKVHLRTPILTFYYCYQPLWALPS